MQFSETPLPGAWIVQAEIVGDERGWFARTFDAAEFGARGLATTVVQANASYNPRRGTLRGLHFQADPHGEPKLVRCVSGTVFDVAVDLRPDSPTYCRWFAAELSAANHRMLYLPAGLAHGFQTLTDDCELNYLMGHRYVPAAASGVRWDDPTFGIDWPDSGSTRIISEKDRAYPDFQRTPA